MKDTSCGSTNGSGIATCTFSAKVMKKLSTGYYFIEAKYAGGANFFRRGNEQSILPMA